MYFFQKIFMIGEHTAKMIILTLILQSLKDVAIVTDFGTNGQCITQVPPAIILCTGISQWMGGSQHRRWPLARAGSRPALPQSLVGIACLLWS